MSFRRKRITEEMAYIDDKATFGVANRFSLQFDGVDEYVDLANPANLRFVSGGVDQPFSVSVWAKMVEATRFRFITKGNMNDDYEWLFTINSLDRVSVFLYGNAAGTVYLQKRGNATITADEGSWHHYLFTYDGSANGAGILMYRDSALISASSIPAGVYTAMNEGEDVARIASAKDDSYYAEGKMDEIMVFDKELTVAEINELYNGGTPPIAVESLSMFSNIINWWRMGDGIHDFPTMIDQIDQNCNGTLTNMEIGDIVEDTP